jgi:hypothetical protein
VYKTPVNLAVNISTDCRSLLAWQSMISGWQYKSSLSAHAFVLYIVCFLL